MYLGESLRDSRRDVRSEALKNEKDGMNHVRILRVLQSAAGSIPSGATAPPIQISASVLNPNGFGIWEFGIGAAIPNPKTFWDLGFGIESQIPS